MAISVVVLVPILALLGRRVDSEAGWIFPIPAILFAACVGGLWPALLLTAFGVGAGILLLGPPATFRDWWPLLVLVATGVSSAFLAENLHRARRRLAAEARRRAQVQEAAQRAQDRYSALFDRSMDCVYLVDFAGRFIDANPAALDLLGYHRDEIPSVGISTLLDDEQMSRARQRIVELRSTGHTALPAEFRVRRKDGQPVYVEVKGSVILHDGEPYAIQGIARDITPRRRAEEALRESQEKFRSLVESMHAAVGMVQGTRFIYANRFMGEMLGYSVEELLALDFPQVVHPAHRERMMDMARRRQLGEDVPSHYEFLAINKWGEPRWVDFSVGRTIYGGEPTIIGAGFDITDRKRVEEQLAAHTHGLSLLANTATRLLATERPREVLREIMDELAHHVGADVYLNYLVTDDGSRLHLHASHGLDPTASTRLETIDFGEQLCGTAAARRHPLVIEAVQRCAGDEVKLVRDLGIRAYACHPLLANNHVEGTISLCARDRDRFSEEELELMRAVAHQAAMALAHQRLSAELECRAAELTQANQAKDHFMAVLSHELRTPLAPVLAAVAVLERDPTLPLRAREDMEMIRRNVELEARLIDDLLDVTRIVRGKIELARQPVDLRAVVRQAVEVCREDIQARGLHFGVTIEPDTPYIVEADAGRLQQVFWNLLKNAIKFTPQGGCVGVTCRPGGGQIAVEVADSGAGIEPEALERIFNPFEQAERAVTRQFGGLGLGLAISKALVELHGGRIEVFSAGKGEGATFTVRLPLVAETDQTPAAPADSGKERPTSPLRTLLVEDHGDTARIMKRLLEGEGHVVQTAGDVATALDLAAHESFDLLISDLGLPDGSGIDLLRTLRQRGQTVPAIALSGYGQEGDIHRSREAGYAAHLTKPISSQRLTDTISATIRASFLR